MIPNPMHENLVIVESPAKAKTIEKILGDRYTVKSSFGHIRDLGPPSQTAPLFIGCCLKAGDPQLIRRHVQGHHNRILVACSPRR